MPPNKSPEPTAVGAVSSAVAVHVHWPGMAELGSLGDITLYENTNHYRSDDHAGHDCNSDYHRLLEAEDTNRIQTCCAGGQSQAAGSH